MDTFDKSELVMNFLINLGVRETLYSFRLVLEGKRGKETPESSKLEFLEKILANNLVYHMQKITPLGRAM